jgi:dynein light intermediate chain
MLVSTSLNAQKNQKGKKGKQQLAPLEKAGTTRNEDYLNSILPPREYTEQGQLWVRYVSPTPATRVDVINLQDDLDKKLQSRQARETGICPIREELYSQCFDELIRQITINCAERGLLLLRVRDEMRMTITAYESLYESSIAYGIRKALMAEQLRMDLTGKLRTLTETKKDLEGQITAMKANIENTLIRFSSISRPFKSIFDIGLHGSYLTF